MKHKMWVATIIPKSNVEAATKTVKERQTKEEREAGVPLPQEPYRVKGQQVRSFNGYDNAVQWLTDNATDGDQVTLRRWRPGKGRKRKNRRCVLV